MARLLLNPLKFFAPLKRIAYGALIAVGIGTAVLFAAVSFLVDVKGLAVLLAAVGAALGALIVSLALPKLLVASTSKHDKELANALAQRAQLQMEIERLGAQQLRVQQVQAVLKLTLLEVDTVLTDFKTESLGTQEKVMGGTETHHYVGVLRKQVKAMLGFDLAKLRVAQRGNELIVDGLAAEFQGVRESADQWLLRQVQARQDNVVMSNKTVVLADDIRLLDLTAKHQGELETRLRNGVEFKAYEGALQRMGQEWLRMTLAPLGLTPVFGPLPQGAHTQPLVEFLAGENKQLEGKRGALQLQLETLGSSSGAPDSQGK
ncbi:MAG: hypothetical protein ACRCV9_02325 [Burkholderiaceae bacterium]